MTCLNCSLCKCIHRLPWSGASTTFTFCQHIVHPLSGKADVFVTNFLSEFPRHQTNNFFVILEGKHLNISNSSLLDTKVIVSQWKNANFQNFYANIFKEKTSTILYIQIECRKNSCKTAHILPGFHIDSKASETVSLYNTYVLVSDFWQTFNFYCFYLNLTLEE